MVQIIETNIDFHNKEHQSRIITYKSWDDYCKLYINYNGEPTENLNGTLIGRVLPRDATITSLKYDDFHLSCDILLYNGLVQIRFAYLINNEQYTLDNLCKI